MTLVQVPGSTVETTCLGCDDCLPCARYEVTYHGGGKEIVWYCEDCASLAEIDWNGETEEIRLLDEEVS